MFQIWPRVYSQFSEILVTLVYNDSEENKTQIASADQYINAVFKENIFEQSPIYIKRLSLKQIRKRFKFKFLQIMKIKTNNADLFVYKYHLIIEI